MQKQCDGLKLYSANSVKLVSAFILPGSVIISKKYIPFSIYGIPSKQRMLMGLIDIVHFAKCRDFSTFYVLGKRDWTIAKSIDSTVDIIVILIY
jgi:hypothetical protein